MKLLDITDEVDDEVDLVEIDELELYDKVIIDELEIRVDEVDEVLEVLDVMFQMELEIEVIDEIDYV